MDQGKKWSPTEKIPRRSQVILCFFHAMKIKSEMLVMLMLDGPIKNRFVKVNRVTREASILKFGRLN